jgi:hypothetical protein
VSARASDIETEADPTFPDRLTVWNVGLGYRRQPRRPRRWNGQVLAFPPPAPTDRCVVWRPAGAVGAGARLHVQGTPSLMALEAWGLRRSAYVVSAADGWTTGIPDEVSRAIAAAVADGRCDEWAPAAIAFDDREYGGLGFAERDAAEEVARSVGIDHVWHVAGDSIAWGTRDVRTNVWRRSLDASSASPGARYDAYVTVGAAPTFGLAE